MLHHVTSVFLLSCVIASCLGAVSRHKRQTGSLCLQGDGRFPVDGDCKSFMECTAGSPQVKMCPHRLVFNPDTQQCDRSATVNGCQDQGHPSDSLCDGNPGTPGESWKVAHPSFCNAFYTCETHFIHKRCEFCGEGTFFSETNGYCVGIKSQDESNPTECSQKQLVPHSQKPILELYPDCNMYQRNPFQSLLNRIEGQQPGNLPLPVGPIQLGPQPGGTALLVGAPQQGPQPVFLSAPTQPQHLLGQPVVFLNPFMNQQGLTVLSSPVLGKK